MKKSNIALTVLGLLTLSSQAHATNYLVVIVDDAGPDKISSYAGDYAGYAPANLPDTQTIDALADAGIRFTRAWATPLCSPTRVSFQTGMFPFRTEIGTALGSSEAGVDTTAFNMLAQSFATNGYVTAHVGKWHLGTLDGNGNTGDPATSPFTVPPHPVLAGWQRFFGFFDGYPGSSYNWDRVSWVTSLNTGWFGTEAGHTTDRTGQIALNWIDQQTDDWLAVVSFSAPHSPDSASSAWQYADADATKYRTPALSCLAMQNCADEKLAVYQGMLEHVDLEIEELLDGIDDAVLDDTMIFFFGDNGTPIAVEESVFNVAGRGKGSTYENGLRVPLIVADGATYRTGAAGDIVSPGRTVEMAVNVIDVFQTLHDHALNIAILDTDSVSFEYCFGINDIYCGNTTRLYGYSETFVMGGGGLSSAKVGLRYGHEKAVVTYDAVNACLDEVFYDTTTDPLETAPQVWTGIKRQRLRDYFVSLHDPVPTSWAWDGGALIPFCP